MSSVGDVRELHDLAEVRGDQAARIAVTFVRVLRGVGLDVPVSSAVAFTDALGVVGIDRRSAAYWAGRSTLVRSPEDHAIYDRVFVAFFGAETGEAPLCLPPEPESLTLAVDRDGDDDGGEGTTDDESIELRFSAVEQLRHKDFAAYSEHELAECQALMQRLRFTGARRRSRRRRPSSTAARPDVARTIRAAFATAGEPIRRHYRAPSERLRRIVLLLDVSGSMDPYARALLRFVHAAVSGRQRVEAFALGTRLTRLTRELSSRDPDRALADVSDRVVDWSGGTRLGEAIAEFNDRWGQRGMVHGAHVVILSDGWDRGDPDALGEEMARLRRLAHQIVWVNPLKVTPGYAPLARGMAAALPHVDHFVEGHSIEAMERLIAVLSGSSTDA